MDYSQALLALETEDLTIGLPKKEIVEVMAKPKKESKNKIATKKQQQFSLSKAVEPLIPILREMEHDKINEQKNYNSIKNRALSIIAAEPHVLAITKQKFVNAINNSRNFKSLSITIVNYWQGGFGDSIAAWSAKGLSI